MSNTQGLTMHDYRRFHDLRVKASTAQVSVMIETLRDELKQRRESRS